MKKIYFIFCLFSLFFGNAQTAILDYQVCDDNNDGFALFDLTTKNAEMLFVLNPGQYSFTYYHSLADTQSETNPILDPANYSNTMNPEQVFASATNTQTQESTNFYFTLMVNPQPFVLGSASLTFCSDSELPIYNLNEALPQLIGSQQNITVTFYDQVFGGNIIANPTFVPTVFPVQVLGVEMSNGCGTVYSTITLNTNNCTTQVCPSPMGLSVSSVSDYSAVLSWMPTATVAAYQVVVVPAGAPAPTASISGVWAQSTPYTFDGLIPNTCYAFYVSSVCNPNSFSEWVGPYNFCTQENCENNGECPDNLTLIAFVDANNNGVKDNGEIPFDMGSYAYEINNSGTMLYGYSNYNGIFRLFDSNPNNSYNLSYAVNPDLSAYYSSATTYTNIQIAAGSGTQTYYFPITQLQSYNDLTIEIIPSGMPRPGFVYDNYIKIKNKGVSNIASGAVTFIKDNAVSIVNITPSGAVNTANGFTFDFTNLAVNEERTILVTMLVPTIPTVTLGQVLTNSASIMPIVDDAFPLNNSDSLSQTIIGSYDPNDKTEAHGGKIAMDTFTENDFLTYTIQFENTGTASAEFIRVEDLLDAGLDANSVVMLNASHPYNMRRVDKNLIWNFYDINLPPTSSNPTQSHGFIQFKIKPTAGYTIGTIIPNTADIYFDYNPPIVTDTFQTEFVETLATTSFDANGFYMYPNPAKTFVNLGLKNSAESIANVNVYDVLGKSVRTVSDIETTQINLDISALTKGVYFVEITTKNQSKITRKLVIQ